MSFIARLFAVLALAISSGGAAAQPALRIGEAPVSDMPGWKLVWVDNFDQQIALGDWRASRSNDYKLYDDGWHEGTKVAGNGTYRYDEVLSQHDGVLDAWLHTNAQGEHVIASIFPKISQNQLYGRYETRWRTTDLNGDGYMYLNIVWPNSNNSVDGEIDHPEYSLGHNWNGRSFIHYRAENPTHHQEVHFDGFDTTQWHTTTLQWMPGLVVLYIDYKEIGRSLPGAWVDQVGSRWGIQMTTKPGAPAPDNAAQTHVLVDYIAIWKDAA